jgi:hypothetical protein
MRTGMRWARRTQVKIGLTLASPCPWSALNQLENSHAGRQRRLVLKKAEIS